ncbi:MAG: hypothetical protein WEA58_11495 [Balneolaceae bacterium]
MSKSNHPSTFKDVRQSILQARSSILLFQEDHPEIAIFLYNEMLSLLEELHGHVLAKGPES